LAILAFGHCAKTILSDGHSLFAPKKQAYSTSADNAISTLRSHATMRRECA